MQQTRRVLSLLLLALLILTSCTRQEVILLSVRAHTAVHKESEEITVTFSLSDYTSQVQVLLSASDAKSSWSLAVSADEGVYTIGPATMGKHIPLPEGQWSLTVMLDDGQWLEEQFSVQRP